MHLKNLLRLEIILVFFAFPLFVDNTFAIERYTIANSKTLKFSYFVSGVPLSGEFHVDRSYFTIDFTEEQLSLIHI